jgi:serine/threonine-protein kinase RsbW
MQPDPRAPGERFTYEAGMMPNSDPKLIRYARFTIPTDLDNVSSVAGALRAFILRHMPEDACNTIELGVVEALTNIVTHGYASIPPGAVDLLFEQSASVAIVKVTDSGMPIPEPILNSAGRGCFDFDPADIECLSEGGRGLAIIKLLFDAVHYQSEGSINQLTLAKRFETSSAADERLSR